ncbi:hypothetical protein [Oceanirhabdus seepicola]|uniref:Prepilin-type N-terminal cleavage/methylation domain-containing protein n=1 Tax=Oceanirhabdus seepicola TaxID=2828781 RepID=A0A9J6P396_9CLOT|nr:hypothetical protein [Oceanirhabdus seepicola]MCM1990844.1 hypothetical protein [Oceanirhabdus seepicola]
MGVIYIKKKKGTSFLEIIIALSIIGIISVAVFNNIYFSLKVNKEIDGKQNSSILAQHVFEEIKNMGDTRFKELVMSIAETNKSKGNNSEDSFLGSKFEEIRSGDIIDELEKYGQNIDSSKVFNKENTDLFVVISFPNLKTGEEEKKSDNKLVPEWKTMKECEVGMEITEHGEIEYEVIFYLKGKEYTKFQCSKEQLFPKVSLEGNVIKIYSQKNKKFEEAITKGNMFIKDNTGEDFSYILSNNGSLGLKLYVEHQTAGNIDFITYGNKIKVYSNDREKTPDGENITIDSLYDFNVAVFREHGNNITKMIELKGHKKIKRFKI